MTDFSLDIRNTLLSTGDGIAKILEECYIKYLGGDGSAIMTALIACSLYQEVIPDWVADELLTLDAKIADKQLHDMNEFFNFEPIHKPKLRMSRNIKKHEEKVVNALFNHRRNGGNFIAEFGLRPIAKELGLSPRLVTNIYNKHKSWIKRLSKNKRLKQGYSINGKLTLLELAKFKRAERDK